MVFFPTDDSQFQSDIGIIFWYFKRFAHTTTTLLAIAIIITIVFGMVAIEAESRSREADIMISPCSSSAAEAHAVGCSFDAMSYCWLPSSCYNAEISSEFASRRNCTWSLDRAREHPVSQATALSGDHGDLWANFEYHLLHYAYMWRKMHRAIQGPLGKAAIDSYIANYTHTEHCEHMTMMNLRKGSGRVNSIIRVKYPDCGMRWSRSRGRHYTTRQDAVCLRWYLDLETRRSICDSKILSLS